MVRTDQVQRVKRSVARFQFWRLTLGWRCAEAKVPIQRCMNLVDYDESHLSPYLDLYINTGELPLWHVPSTFATYTCQRVLCHLTCMAASAKSGVTLFRQIVTLRELLCRYRIMFRGLSGNTWGDQK